MNQREGRSGDVVLTDISPAAGEASGATDLLWDRPELKDIFHLLNASSANGTLSQHNRTKPMADVSIPGMSTIFGEGSVSRRCVWCFLLVLCISVASIQVQDRVRYFLTTPVNVNVRVTMKESLPFPVITICNKNMFNVTRIVQIGANSSGVSADNISSIIGLGGFDAEDVWDATAHSLDRIVVECWFGRGLRCRQMGEWKKVPTYMGVCYSFLLNVDSVNTSGMFNQLYLKLEDPEPVAYRGDHGWKILIHDRSDAPTIDVRTHGTTLIRGWARDIRVYVRQFRQLNTWGRPCTSGSSYSQCIWRCFERQAMAELSCHLPFFSGTKTTYCATPGSYYGAEKTLEQLLSDGRWSSNNCRCPRQCEQYVYVPSTEASYPMPESQKHLNKIRVFFQDMTYDDIEETYAYTSVSLLCDIGGSLGFLLGISVPTLFELVDATVRATIRWAVKRLARFCH